MNSIQIKDKKINDFEKCYIMAEAGSNHAGNKENAYELIDLASDSGADAIKFQLFKAKTLYSKVIGEEIYNKTKSVELPIKWIPDLIDRCESKNIVFLATPFDKPSVDILIDNDIAAFKWASGEIDNYELISYASKFLKPMIISTGMCGLSDVENAIDIVNSQKNEQIALLHCISNYPTQSNDANLKMMDTLYQSFDYPIGFSDHTTGYFITLAAVARGAKIIEKHITLDKNLQSPDHFFSLKPLEFKEMVRGIREVESSLGNGKKRIIENEIPISKVARRSLVANRDIPQGVKINKSMISYKRPGTGISLKYLPFVIGRKTNREIKNDEIISLDMFS